MSSKVFEYFFDPDDLEPFYSELPQSFIEPRTKHEGTPATSSERVRDEPGSNCDDPSENAALPPSNTCDQPAWREQPKKHATTKAPAQEASGGSQRVVESDARVDEKEDVKQVPTAAESVRTRVRRLISVHTLGQYVFCVRSAILSAEKGDARDIDEPLPRFTYLPNFDRERIEEMLSAKMTQLGFFVLYAVCLAILLKMGLAEQNRWVFYPSFMALFGICFWSLNIIVCVIDLAMRRRAAIRAEAREPEPNITRIERVNWWSMLKAGFESISYERPFQHPELPLEGSPWRVLQRGSRRIPVIKSGSHKLGDRKCELYPKHQVRLVAYAMLLESAGHIEVPYGVVLPVDSPRGLAFPITQELRQKAVRLLYDFERKLAESQYNKIQPQLPENRNRCAQCDYGRPVLTTAKDIENALKSGEQLVVLQHRTGEFYRCECADRFGSAPPHGLTVKKGLKAVVY